MDPFTLFALANGAVQAVKKGCQLYKDIKSATGDVKGILKDLDNQFHKKYDGKPVPEAAVKQLNEEKARVKELNKRSEETTNIYTEIGDYLGQYYDNYFKCLAVLEDEEKRSKNEVYSGGDSLAKRALIAALPNKEDFDYSMRVVSEITESNGSSSMASVCGGCLALIDAGVPMKNHVAGIAMGLIKEGNRVAVLTDILGDEDHLGDMDFKVAGTEDGITALQMDIKITGITAQIMQVALAQAKEGRTHILGIMKTAMSNANTEMSAFAPRIITMKINPEKIRDVIGKGGAVIRALTEETGTTIDIDDTGTVKIACTSSEQGAEAQRRIAEITAEVEIGNVYEGTVLKLLDFGAIVSLIPGKDGLLHISQIAHQRVNAVSDFLKEGDVVKVKVVEADEKGRVRLSMKALIDPPAGETQE